MVQAEAIKQGSCAKSGEEGSRGRNMGSPRCLLASKKRGRLLPASC